MEQGCTPHGFARKGRASTPVQRSIVERPGQLLMRPRLRSNSLQSVRDQTYWAPDSHSDRCEPSKKHSVIPDESWGRKRIAIESLCNSDTPVPVTPETEKRAAPARPPNKFKKLPSQYRKERWNVIPVWSEYRPEEKKFQEKKKPS